MQFPISRLLILTLGCLTLVLASLNAWAGGYPSEYSVNLMWINKSLIPEQKYIYPAKNENELHALFLKHVLKWAALTSEGGRINIWYDGNHTPPHAVDATQALMKKIEIERGKDLAPIFFRDVRTLPEVIEYAEVFSPLMPVYFRVDLLRAITLYHMTTTGESTTCVYGDIDMEAISKKELFDEETVGNLDKFGIVMARGGHLGFENGFQIVSSANPNLLKAMKLALIDVNIARAKRVLTEIQEIERASAIVERSLTSQSARNEEYSRPILHVLKQIVYDSYPNMFRYFFHLEGLETLMVLNAEGWQPFDEHRDGWKAFGKKKVLDARFIRLASESTKAFKVQAPTKKVFLPSAGLNY